jgi:hypothetical protein
MVIVDATGERVKQNTINRDEITLDPAELDVYVCERSDVEFTHSVCPGCQEKLYPELSK